MKFVIIYGHVFDLLDHVFLIGQDFKSLLVCAWLQLQDLTYRI